MRHVGQKKILTKVFKGGLYFTLREIFASALSLVNVIVTARILGPELYGVVIIALGIFHFLVWTGKIGLNIFLIRQRELPTNGAAQVLSYFNTVGIAICIAIWFGAPLLGWWTDRSELTMLMRCLTIALWLEMVASVSISMLERELEFARVGMIEMVAHIANYGLTIPLVLLGYGVWGPIFGVLVQHLFLAVLAVASYPVTWLQRWHWSFIGPALRYGAGISLADWILSLKELTIPLFVSRIAGMEAAGIAGFTLRIVDQLGLLRIVTKRIAVGAISRIIDDHTLLLKTISQWIAYLILMVGPIYAVFSILSKYVIPMVFRTDWALSSQVFPPIAFALMIHAIFDLQMFSLYVGGKIRDLILSNAAYIAALWLSAVALLPLFAIWGYCAAEILALLSFFLLNHFFRRHYGRLQYATAVWLVLATMPALFAGPWIHPGASFGILLVSYGVILWAKPDIIDLLRNLVVIWRTRSEKSPGR